MEKMMTENTQPNNDPAERDPPKPEADGEKGGAGDGDKTVNYETHRRLLDEKKRVQAELDKLLTEKQARERKELEDQGNWKKLLEQREAENAELKSKLSSSEEQEKGRRKMAAILGSAGGTIESKWYDLVANSVLDMVAVNPDTGEVDQLSVTKAVEKLKASYPEIIKGKGGPGLPNSAPGAGSAGAGKILRSEWLKLSSREMTKYKADQIVDG